VLSAVLANPASKRVQARVNCCALLPQASGEGACGFHAITYLLRNTTSHIHVVSVWDGKRKLLGIELTGLRHSAVGRVEGALRA
jgi:hypothetical protein